jgi:phosphatidylglycerol:prolipoprotein diacylglycerol transferase
MFNLLHTFNPQPILFKLGFLEIHWYGFLIALGAGLAFWVFYYLAKQYGLKKDDIYNLVFYVVIFGLIGDRLYYVLYAWEYYSQNLLDIFKIWEGGLAIHGAMISGIIVIWVYARRHKLSPWLILDILVVCLALAMAIGRWGNYFNQELFGWPTNLAWGIPILPAHRPAELMSFSYFHPTFIYESIWNLLIFISLFIWHKVRLAKQIGQRPTSLWLEIKNPDSIRGYGNIALAYFILYSTGRFLNEFLRIDYSPLVFGVRWAQIVSLSIIIFCLLILIYKFYKKVIQRSETK